MPDPREISTTDDVQAALDAPRAVLFKYGTHCPISAAARAQLGGFIAEYPDAVVYQVAVDECRDVSDFIAEKLGVAHASPQAFLLRQGEITWQATHHAIRTSELCERWQGAGQ